MENDLLGRPNYLTEKQRYRRDGCSPWVPTAVPRGQPWHVRGKTASMGMSQGNQTTPFGYVEKPTEEGH